MSALTAANIALSSPLDNLQNSLREGTAVDMLHWTVFETGNNLKLGFLDT
jgi:hypothetical protein